jgi:general secretion pathway protein G
MASRTATGELETRRWRWRCRDGFTLIELMVVMAIVATLLSIAVPRYFKSVDRSKETVLKQSLTVMREAIDRHYGDTGRYPESLDDLVTKRYLRKLPVDPVTDSATTWVIVEPPPNSGRAGVYDVKSGAEGAAQDGTAFAEW